MAQHTVGARGFGCNPATREAQEPVLLPVGMAHSGAPTSGLDLESKPAIAQPGIARWLVG